MTRRLLRLGRPLIEDIFAMTDTTRPAFVISAQTGRKYAVMVEGGRRISASDLSSESFEGTSGLPNLYLEDGRRLTSRGNDEYMSNDGEMFRRE